MWDTDHNVLHYVGSEGTSPIGGNLAVFMDPASGVGLLQQAGHRVQVSVSTTLATSSTSYIGGVNWNFTFLGIPLVVASAYAASGNANGYQQVSLFNVTTSGCSFALYDLSRLTFTGNVGYGSNTSFVVVTHAYGINF